VGIVDMGNHTAYNRKDCPECDIIISYVIPSYQGKEFKTSFYTNNLITDYIMRSMSIRNVSRDLVTTWQTDMHTVPVSVHQVSDQPRKLPSDPHYSKSMLSLLV